MTRKKEINSTNPSLCNHQKARRSSTVFSKKRLEKRKSIHPTHHTISWIVLKNGVFDSSILLEMFSFVSKFLSCNTEKTAEMR